MRSPSTCPPDVGRKWRLSSEETGFVEAEAALDRLPAYLENRVAPLGLFAAAKIVRDRARQLVRVSSPEAFALRQRTQSPVAHLQATIKAYKRKKSARVWAGGKAALHPIFLEYGTIKTPARPFLHPALFDTQAEQITAGVTAMRAALRALPVK